MNIEKLPPLIGLKDIMRATMRLPYTESELQAVTNYITYNRGKGLDTQLEATFANYADSLIAEGVLIISSPAQLQYDVVLVKLNAGKGLFGRQKVVYGTYLGASETGEFMPGTTFKLFGVALTSINNMYRGAGLL